MHRLLQGQTLWQDLWELGYQEQITVYVTGHATLSSPGNDEADSSQGMMAGNGACQPIRKRSSPVATQSPLNC